MKYANMRIYVFSGLGTSQGPVSNQESNFWVLYTLFHNSPLGEISTYPLDQANFYLVSSFGETSLSFHAPVNFCPTKILHTFHILITPKV